MIGPFTPPDTVLVVFGGNGDLARRKLLPALYHLHREGLMPERWRLLGVARSRMDDAGFRGLALRAVRESARCGPGDGEWEAFARRLTFVSTDFRPGRTDAVRVAVERLEADVGGAPCRLFYLSTPPSTFGPIAQGLGDAGLVERSRVVFEKPFGSDVDSFARLDAIVRGVLAEEQTYRIDHYLAKETVQNILAFRFANGAFEAMWNRAHIDHVQIDVPEELDVGDRAAFYEHTGAVRDMLVTHLFQVLSVIAMEPPTRLETEPLITEKFKVFDSMRDLSPDDVVLGQYAGYRDTDGVAGDSPTDTFVAARVHIDNWRWDGVPFFLRTGKAMAASRQRVTLAFRRPPAAMFRDVPRDGGLDRDRLSFELDGDGAVTFAFLAKEPGPSIELGGARMTFTYRESFGSELVGPYERLIHDALLGDRTLFTRADGIARAWEVIAPLLSDHEAPRPYARGSWGPDAAADLIAPRHWYLPELAGGSARER